ncbi:VanZ family protein [Peribacillus saganii]|uniref:VanZ family protein n=1 Tax=Peribacillus saganii TaxID=2303992 RepID=A0A372LR59_9BACI|nr:VanZ family protein [Peribacillus saganii]RFU69530.1 VanZ family protein [Peribacillus saganii]
MKFKPTFVLFIPLVIWAFVIFYFSSQPYKEQDITPLISKYANGINWSEYFGWVHFSYSNSIISIEKLGVPHFIEFFIRKAAHLFIFFVLGFLTIRILHKYSASRFISLLGSFFFIVLYAALDELHQKFTGGRTPLAEDVLIDSIGGTLGILAYFLFVFIRGKKKKN